MCKLSENIIKLIEDEINKTSFEAEKYYKITAIGIDEFDKEEELYTYLLIVEQENIRENYRALIIDWCDRAIKDGLFKSIHDFKIE